MQGVPFLGDKIIDSVYQGEDKKYGRNLLKNTSFLDGFNHFQGSASNTIVEDSPFPGVNSAEMYGNTTIGSIPGNPFPTDNYIASVWVKIVENPNNGAYNLRAFLDGNQQISMPSFSSTDGVWKQIEIIIPDTLSFDRVVFRGAGTSGHSGAVVRVAGFKIQKGTDPTVGKNLIDRPNDFSPENGWSNFGGATIIRTPNQIVPEWGAKNATRIQTSGGTNIQKTIRTIYRDLILNQNYTASLYIKNNKSEEMQIRFGGFRDVTVPPNFIGRIVETREASTSNMSLSLSFRTRTSPDRDLDFIVWNAQLSEVGYPWTPAPEDLLGR